MSTSHRRIAAALVVAALVAAAVALVAGGGRPVAAFIADVTGCADDRRTVADATAAAVRRTAPVRADGAAWDRDDGDDADAAGLGRPRRAAAPGPPHRAPSRRAVGGVPVVVLGTGENGPVLAGPKMTNSEGRVRFPIDLAMEQEHEVVVAARAVPGRAGDDARSRSRSTSLPT